MIIQPANVHASAVIVGDRGILITGASGVGKTALALALLDAATISGRFASLVADDQVFLRTAGGRLLACAPPSIAGLVEVWGLGPRATAYRAHAAIDLAVSLVPAAEAPRYAENQVFEHCGLTTPMIVLPARSTGNVVRAVAAWLHVPPFC